MNGRATPTRRKSIAQRNLAMEAVRVTEAAARAVFRHIGRGDDKIADQAAIDAMYDAIQWLDIAGTIRIGEGAPDEVPKLFSGETVGSGDGPVVDVALMALEGRAITARGGRGGLSVLAMAEDGGFLNTPDIYMDKIAVGGRLPKGVVDLDEEPAKNLKALAKAKRLDIGDLVVCILDRPRHAPLIAKVREAGARVMLIADGDVSGVIATIWPESGIDLYLGIGGAAQGVLAAAALCCADGQMQGRLVFRSDDEKRRAALCGITDVDRKYTAAEMAAGQITFAATGVTNGDILRGMHREHGVVVTHSLVMRSKTGTLRYVEGHHRFAERPVRR